MDICNAIRCNDETDGNSSSDLDSLTRIIPEYLVSVKLETENSNSSACPAVVNNNPPPPRMHNNDNDSSSAGHRPPAFNRSAMMPDFSAWVQHTNQTLADGHHHHGYRPPHETKSTVGPNPKVPGNASGIGGLVNGDVCDSSTFLNYVLNQQRSNGIFMFDPRAGADPSLTGQGYGSSAGCQNCVARSRNADSETATYRDASTNTPAKYCGLEHARVECAKCRTKTDDSNVSTSKNFYNQLGLRPQRPVPSAPKCDPSSPPPPPCGNCGRPNAAPDAPICGECTTPTTKCKCVRDCGAGCVKDNRRLHFLDVDRPYTCDICLKNYPSEGSLVNHLRYHKGSRPYQCETCNKAFATNSHLTTHRRTHSGEKPFECPDCFKTFSDRSSYVKHSRTHGPDGSTVKKFKCPVCGNMFVDSCGLKKHIRIHTGERPYVCGVCDKAFATSSTFVAHKRIHSGERPYSCPTCSKRFITKSHLLTHGRVHSGEKPFCCQVCNRAFADGSSYRRHERLHTGENRYTCDVCGKAFPYESSLLKHKQSHVPGTPTYVYMTA